MTSSLTTPPNRDEERAHEDVREQCRDLAHFLNEHLPASREKSLAITHLQKTMMMANAAIAIHGIPEPSAHDSE